MVSIGLLVERQRAYGRRLCEGAAARALEDGDILLTMLEWSEVLAPEGLKKFNALIVRVLDDGMDRLLRRAGIPIVDVFYGKDRPGFAVADLDNETIGRLAADHLRSHGFNSFAFCGYNGINFSDSRRDAFARVVTDMGFPCNVYPTPPHATRDFAKSAVLSECYSLRNDERKAMEQWLVSLPHATAVFCSHDLRARQILEICYKVGIAVPSDIAVLGVDDDAILCGFSAPTLSSIDPNGFEVGRAAVEIAAEMARSPKAGATMRRQFVKPLRLVERRSTETYPLDPGWLSDALVFIHRNASKGIRSSDVFEQLGLSHTMVGTAFRRVLRTTVQKEIIKTRLDEACRLLLHTGYSIAEIARRSGFASAQYFCRCFFATKGISPSRYRFSENAM